MSDLYRSAMSARLAKLPVDLPPLNSSGSFDEDDEADEAGDSLGSLPGSGMGPPAMPGRRTLTKPKKPPNPAFSPISASTFFDQALQVLVPERNLDCRVYYTPPKFVDGTVMVCQHGAGFSGLSFACMAKEIMDLGKGECGVLAVDARRHGKTTSTESDEDLSITVLVADFVGVIQTLFSDPTAVASLLLIGHSMGGSIVTRACPLLIEKGYHIAGVAVLDVVEGSAMEALPHMHNLLNARPDGFDSVEEAIEWHVNTKTIRNPTSARVSVPGIVVPSPSPSPYPSSSPSTSTSTSTGTSPAPGVKPVVWRTTLRSTAAYWKSWFLGLSTAFLSARTARLLVLAGTDRLDRELMIGQMQGKFQMVVVSGTGHMVHEDDPTRLAEILVEFWRRNERVVGGVKVKKVGEM